MLAIAGRPAFCFMALLNLLNQETIFFLEKNPLQTYYNNIMQHLYVGLMNGDREGQ